MYDLIIVGAGPAGITAGIYAARKKMDFLILTGDVGGQAGWSGDVENYIGYQFITGMELVDKFREHLEAFHVQLKEGEPATLVTRKDDVILVKTDKAEYESRTAIIATGRDPRRLGAQGEEEYRGLGVTYCATCDGPLFSGKNVAVVGGGNAGLDATLQLIKIASRIDLIEISPELRADPIMVEKAKQSGKVTFHTSTSVEKIYGDRFVQGIKAKTGGEARDIPVQGIFIEIGSTPASQIAPELRKNEYGEILVNCKSRTNVTGIFAAGDVTDVPAKQIIVACGEGCKALLAAFEYLSTHK